MAEVGSGPSHDLQLLLEDFDPAVRCPQLRLLITGGTGLAISGVAGVEVGLAQPLLQSAFMDPEVRGDLGDRGVLIPVLSEPDDIVAELLGDRA